MMSSQDKLKQLTRCGLFTTIALTIFMIESRIPLPFVIPGAKLGLSNCVTIYVAYTMGIPQASQVLFCRILLGAFFSGQLATLFYSGAGGLFCLILLTVLIRFCPWDKIWFVSPCCALAHNFGQIFMASFIMDTTAVFYFLPYLQLLGLISGLFIGIATQQLVGREKKKKGIQDKD